MALKKNTQQQYKIASSYAQSCIYVHYKETNNATRFIYLKWATKIFMLIIKQHGKRFKSFTCMWDFLPALFLQHRSYKWVRSTVFVWKIGLFRNCRVPSFWAPVKTCLYHSQYARREKMKADSRCDSSSSIFTELVPVFWKSKKLVHFRFEVSNILKCFPRCRGSTFTITTQFEMADVSIFVFMMIYSSS